MFVFTFHIKHVLYFFHASTSLCAFFIYFEYCLPWSRLWVTGLVVGVKMKKSYNLVDIKYQQTIMEVPESNYVKKKPTGGPAVKSFKLVCVMRCRTSCTWIFSKFLFCGTAHISDKLSLYCLPSYCFERLEWY